MTIFAGKQKAWFPTLASFGVSLMVQIATGVPIDVTQAAPVAAIAADVASSAVIAGVTWVGAYFARNRTKKGVVMRFVDNSGTIVDAADRVVGKLGTIR